MEIKFRLHDKEGNVIGYEEHVKNEFGCYQILQTSIREDWHENDRKNVREGYFIAATYKSQFTNLKDKKGKDIYEGDILREVPKNDWEKENYACFEVFFHDGDAASDYNIGYTMDRMHCHGAVAGGVVLSFKPKTVSKMIVIGNIHENKTLMK